MSLFILDSNFFIQAHRVTYPVDVVPGFWNKVKRLADDRKIISIDKVKDEIFLNEDELTRWIENNLPTYFFKDSQTSEVLECYKQIAQWANRNTHYKQSAISDFLELKRADAWLVAYASSLNGECCLVTQEISVPHRRSSIKIPDVCDAFNISYLKIIEMFRALSETF